MLCQRYTLEQELHSQRRRSAGRIAFNVESIGWQAAAENFIQAGDTGLLFA